jgi:hypothetical protein
MKVVMLPLLIFRESSYNEIIHVKLHAEMATLLAEINPQKYKPYLRTEGGKPVIYMKLKK